MICLHLVQIEDPFDILPHIYTDFKKSNFAALCKDLAERKCYLFCTDGLTEGISTSACVHACTHT